MNHRRSPSFLLENSSIDEEPTEPSRWWWIDEGRERPTACNSIRVSSARHSELSFGRRLLRHGRILRATSGCLDAANISRVGGGSFALHPPTPPERGAFISYFPQIVGVSKIKVAPDEHRQTQYMNSAPNALFQYCSRDPEAELRVSNGGRARQSLCKFTNKQISFQLRYVRVYFFSPSFLRSPFATFDVLSFFGRQSTAAGDATSPFAHSVSEQRTPYAVS